VRLNSVVRIKADDKEETMEFSLVTPDKADIKTRRSPSWRQWVRH
jgi:transcription elongation GreA/GreB family factor